ncbi:MAG: DUF393 domain-containing protein, partial [Chromatiaceae bacterium]|nr:DUF393 domain-containing protein [Chromatiaceae bacterium]
MSEGCEDRCRQRRTRALASRCSKLAGCGIDHGHAPHSRQLHSLQVKSPPGIIVLDNAPIRNTIAYVFAQCTLFAMTILLHLVYIFLMDTKGSKSAEGPAEIVRARPVVLYDGACPLCRKEITHYRRLAGDREIAWIDITRGAERIAALGIPLDQAMQRFHVRDPAGNWHTGAFAFAELWRHLPAYRFVAALLR